MSWCPHLRTDLERKNRGVLHLKGLLLTISLAREYPHCFFLSSHFFCKQSKKGNFILAAALADEVFIWSSEHICIQPHAVSALSDSIQDKKNPQKTQFYILWYQDFSWLTIHQQHTTMRTNCPTAVRSGSNITATHHRKRFHFLHIQPLYD